jgi:acyl carrier protein phosphodiesterase
MNHLAHALLSAPDEDVMLGGLIADFLRGRVDPALPRGVRLGIALHRAVDVYTDSHAEVAAARARFEPPYRRYAGILLDIWFDHLLAREWATYGVGTLHEFSARVRELLMRRDAELPESMRSFVRYLLAHDLPERYREPRVIGEVLRGMSTRLSRANPLAEALPVLQGDAAALERHFAAFFPQLLTHARAQRERLDAALPD